MVIYPDKNMGKESDTFLNVMKVWQILGDSKKFEQVKSVKMAKTKANWDITKTVQFPNRLPICAKIQHSKLDVETFFSKCEVYQQKNTSDLLSRPCGWRPTTRRLRS